MELDPYPTEAHSGDAFSIGFFREERPSFYWVNVGVPDAFFAGVSQISNPPVVYSVRSIEYGVWFSGWLNDHWQARMVIPFEANALEDAAGKTQHLTQVGDMEVATTFLLTGKRERGFFAGLDGSFRLPTGSNPFTQPFPLLSSGKGVPEEKLGLLLGQEVGGFSFFQSIHYQTSQPLTLDPATSILGPGLFQWPDELFASGRIEWKVFQRSQRSVSLFYELSMRSSGLMTLDQKVLTYGQTLTTNRVLNSTFGLTVRAEKEFSAEGRLSYYPWVPFGEVPANGLLFSLSLVFRPI